MSFFSFPQQLTEWTSPMGFFSEPWRLFGCIIFLFLAYHYLLPYLRVHNKKEQLYRRMPTPVTSPILGRLLGHLELYWNAPAGLKNLSPSVCKLRGSPFPPPPRPSPFLTSAKEGIVFASYSFCLFSVLPFYRSTGSSNTRNRGKFASPSL